MGRYHHGDLRGALLRAAEAELAEKGVEAFSLRGCAKRAGVSHAAPAHHFPTADHLLTALAAVGFERLAAAMRRAAARVPQPPGADTIAPPDAAPGPAAADVPTAGGAAGDIRVRGAEAGEASRSSSVASPVTGNGTDDAGPPPGDATPAAGEAAPEHIPLGSKRSGRQEYAQAFESAAISDRPGDSIRSESALVTGDIASAGGDPTADPVLPASLAAMPVAEARLVAAGLGYIAFAEANPALFKLMFGSDRPMTADPALQAAGAAAYGVLVDAVAAVRRAAAGEGAGNVTGARAVTATVKREGVPGGNGAPPRGPQTLPAPLEKHAAGTETVPGGAEQVAAAWAIAHGLAHLLIERRLFLGPPSSSDRAAALAAILARATPA